MLNEISTEAWCMLGVCTYTEYHENVRCHILVIARVWCIAGLSSYWASALKNCSTITYVHAETLCVLWFSISRWKAGFSTHFIYLGNHNWSKIFKGSTWEECTLTGFTKMQEVVYRHPQTLTVEFPLLGSPSVVKWPTRQRLLHMWHSIKLSLAHGYHSNQIKHTLSTCTE